MPIDEYASYAPQLLGLLKRGASVEQLTLRLSELRVDRIGMQPAPEHDTRVALKLTDWFEES